VSLSLPLVHIDQLQPGMFVSLDLGWLDHPFLVNSFLIKNEKQLATLRELGLHMVSYDPQRSETQPRPLEAEPEALVTPQINPENQRLIEEKRMRIGRMTAHRERIVLLEKQYKESIASAKDVLTGILRDPRQAIAQANAMSASLTSTFLDDQGATVMMVAANKLDDLANQHALNVMILTMVICKGLGVGRDVMSAAGVGALLHDIGKTAISNTVLRKSPRNQAEETLYRLHCDYGLTIVGEHANPGVRAVIRQHHECADGSGFPQGVKGPQINPLARIVAIADRYDTLCNPLRLADALPPAEALSSMFAREAKRFDTAMLSVFIHELGVYPPGSFVQLSNGSIALVIAATASSTLKPTVLVYEPGVPRREAVVINLTESPDVKIDCVLRPSALKQDVVEYLNPRMRLSYYAQKTGS
jgi:HD-GYP domain-containing protein (c-di-GMP phosphodiesterase class II)